MQEAYAAYFQRLSHMEIKYGVPMRTMTSFRIGGPANLLFPATEEALAEALGVAAEMGVQPFVLGNGTNLLVRDGGIEEPVLCVGQAFSRITRHDNEYMAGAGALFGAFARQTVRDGFMGLEWAAGIPGSVGGAVAMNAGAYGGETGQCLRRVRYIERGKLQTAAVREGELGYRQSPYSAPERVTVAAEFALMPDDGHSAERMEAFLAQRKAKQPLAYPSAGSVFKRPPGQYAGALIQQAGLKGARVGGAQVSELHAGFIVNTGGATCADVCALIALVRRRVLETSGVELPCEVKIIGKDCG